MKDIFSTIIKSLAICLFLTIGNNVLGQLSGWGYVTPIVLTETSGSNLTNYQTLVIVDTQTPIGAGKMNADGSDIRFAADITGATLLDFWVDTAVNTTTTEIWVEVPSIPASGATTIYFFYGKPSALSASNGDSTFIFFDDFASGTIDAAKWAISTGTGGDVTTAVSNYAAITDDGTQGIKTPQTLNSFSQPFIMDLKFQYQFTGENNHYGFILSDGFQTMGIYSGAVAGNHSAPCLNNDIVEVLFGATSDNPSTFTYDDCITPFQWHDFETRISSSTMAMNADGFVLDSGQAIGTAAPMYLSLGGYWNQQPWEFYGGSETRYDDIRIRQYSGSEPTIAVGAEAIASYISVVGGSFCAGDSISLTVVVDTASTLVPPYTYAWTPSTGLTCDTCITTYASPSTNTTYLIIVTDSAGSQDSTNTTVTVMNVPVADGGNPGQCPGDSVQLFGTGGTSYLWIPGTGLSDSTIANPWASPTADSSYLLVAINACGVDTDTVVIIPVIPVADASSNTSFCVGGSVQLTVTGGVSYLWSPDTSLSCTACDKTTATPASDITYYVTMTDSFGCTASDSVLVEVNGKNIIIRSVKTAVCSPGDSTQLSVVEDCPDVQVGNGTSSSATYGPFFGSSTDAHYQFLYTAAELTAAGLSAGSFYDVAFNILTKNSTGQYENFRLSMGNSSVNCMVATSGWEATTVVYGPTNYTTSPGWNTFVLSTPFFWDGTSNLIIETCYDNPDGAGPGGADAVEYLGGFSCDMTMRYYTNTTGSNGCALAASYDYNSRANIRFSCPGNTLDSTITYAWTPAATLSDTTINNPVASPTTNTSYIVVANDGGCFTTDTITVFMDTTVITASIDTNICLGDSRMISVSSSTPAASYLWSPSAGLSSTTIQSPTAAPSGTVTYSVQVTNMDGCVHNDSMLLIVDTVPTAAFASATSDLTSTFTNNSVNGTSYLWDFGDGFFATVSSPVHTYNSNGTYTVCLTTTNYCGTDSICGSVTVALGGCVNTVAAFDTISVELTAVFTDMSTDATTWTWDFGDGGSATSQNPVYTYVAPGSYNVCLITTNPCSSDTTCVMMTITSSVPCIPPVAGFTASSFGLSAVFSDASSDATVWSWNFGDGNTSTSQNPVNTYLVDGTYNVCLITTNACGSDTSCMNVIVAAAACPQTTAAFTSSASGLIVGFTDTSTDPTSWAWDFGDGFSSTDQNPSHVYALPGTYSVCLVVANPCNADSICSSITITTCPIPVAGFTPAMNGLIVSFTDGSTNTTSWTWDFGDGNSSNAQNPTYTFGAAGTYSVCLVASSGCATDTICTSLTVTGCAEVIAAFTFADTLLNVDFTDISANAATWSWDFGDGSALSTLQNPTHTYATAGIYDVCLTSSSACSTDNTCFAITVGSVGIEEEMAVSMEIYPNPTDGILNVNVPKNIGQDLTLTIYNVIGELVYSAKQSELTLVNSSKSHVQYSLQLGFLANGSYLLKVQSEDKLFMEQVVFSR